MVSMRIRPSRGFVGWGVALSMSIGLRAPAWAQAEAQPEAPPPAAEAPAPTRVNIVSTGLRQWDVFIDGQPMCSTPCSGPLYPQQGVVLQSQERRPVILEVGLLPPGDLVLSAKPYENGRYAGGVVATTLGGMALAIGITFTAVGLAKDRAGFTTAGLITGGAGLLTLPYGLYLMLSAVPSFTVERAAPGPAVGLGGSF
jgi:hypothetical protein